MKQQNQIWLETYRPKGNPWTPLRLNTVKIQETATVHRDVTVAHYNLVMLDRELTRALGGRLGGRLAAVWFQFRWDDEFLRRKRITDRHQRISLEVCRFSLHRQRKPETTQISPLGKYSIILTTASLFKYWLENDKVKSRFILSVRSRVWWFPKPCALPTTSCCLHVAFCKRVVWSLSTVK